MHCTTDHSIVCLDESKLQKRLYFCFQNSRMAPFPLSLKNEQKNKEKAVFLNLHCYFWMSWFYFDVGSFDM